GRMRRVSVRFDGLGVAAPGPLLFCHHDATPPGRAAWRWRSWGAGVWRRRSSAARTDRRKRRRKRLVWRREAARRSRTAGGGGISSSQTDIDLLQSVGDANHSEASLGGAFHAGSTSRHFSSLAADIADLPPRGELERQGRTQRRQRIGGSLGV